MATMQGISGGLSGKMGSVVFRQRGGQTIASQYQPSVKNPNSEGQQNTRAAFKLMSQLGAIMQPALGTIGINTRPARVKGSQRNGFFKLNYPLVETADENGQVTAKIPMEKLQLTSSFRALPNLIVGQGFEDGSLGISVRIENAAVDITTLRICVINYRGNGITQAAIDSITDLPLELGDGDTVIPVSGAGNYTILAYGLIPSESAISRLDLDNIHTPADENFISAVKLDAMVAAGEMAETMTVGANITVTSA